MKWNLQLISQWTDGEILSTHVSQFSEIGTDTRKDLTGQIFIALKGDSFDAHQYLDKAVQQGAAALLVHELPTKFEALKQKVSIILVKDTLIALQQFAHHYRKSLPTKIIGITGSNGKTTTKEFAAQIIGAYRKTHYSQGSFNNHWGVPMTLLQTPPDAEFAVVEMGMNHAGEITQLVQIAEPDVVICTMVGTAHLEFFGTQKNIAAAKSEIYLDSKPEAIRIFNQDQELTYDMMLPVTKKHPSSRMLTFSERHNEADVYFKIDELTMRGIKISGIIAGEKGEAKIPIFGKQNLTNLMAAATIAHACKLNPEQIWKALPFCQTAWGRNQFIETKIGAEILFDGYNANPDSMKALLENIPLLKTEGNKIGVFGQMKELGAAAAEGHREIAQLAAKAGFKQIYFIGEDHLNFSEGLANSNYTGEVFIKAAFESSMGEKLKASLHPHDIVVIKGSRGAGTERFVEFCEPLHWSAKK
ncbi:MAG: UDP-N-acetylmuramoyl-tripeptide--D-alanyl-D-alanine ligase [Bdellovibrionaceae bacterium]|nr:UDP-N-acetylmuramoyl-tripeptide--D-alanyl-D-alanine ligase [Bdellovibrio sp.]